MFSIGPSPPIVSTPVPSTMRVEAPVNSEPLWQAEQRPRSPLKIARPRFCASLSAARFPAE